jgi:hypothetical protein
MKSPYLIFLGPIAALILGVLFRFRVFPFLKSDTILSGGRQVATAEFAAFMSGIFFIFAAASLVVAVVYFFIRRRKGTHGN